jgi:UDP-GlcNAc:undecaprenyl-phosphate/decaprenyl-phosphate GlcNAc-1-phosphate transferase
MESQQLLILFSAGFLASLLSAPLFIQLAEKVGVVDHPGHRKIHRKPIPYLGGVVIFFALAASMAMCLALNWSHYQPGLFIPSKNLSLLASCLCMVVLGLWDDFFGLKVRYKFAGQIAVALLFSTLCYRFEVLHLPGFSPYVLPVYIAVPLTTFWILSIINAINMVDGIDGLASSVAAVSFLLVAACASLMGNSLQAGMALSAVGALLGFLFFNWRPARIYLGDSGSGGLGMFLAASLLGLGKSTPYFSRGLHPEPSQPFSYQIIILTSLAAYPAIEITLSVARRIFRGKPVHRADQGHIHHRFLKKGWAIPAIVLTAMVVSLLPGLAAVMTLMNERGLAVWFLGLGCLVIGLGLPLLGFLDFLQPHALIKNRPHFQIANHFTEMQKLKLQQAGDFEEVVTLLGQTCNEFGVQGYRLFVRPDEDGRGGCHCSWERSLREHRAYLSYLKTVESTFNMTSFKDHAVIDNGRGEAFWIFEPHTEESELDVEYRVLVHEFITEALKKIAALNPERREMDSKVVSMLSSHKSLSSSFLRRRHAPGGSESAGGQGKGKP